MEHESDIDTNRNPCPRNDPQRIDKGVRRIRNLRTSTDQLNYSIIEIGQKTEKSPGDLRRLAVT